MGRAAVCRAQARGRARRGSGCSQGTDGGEVLEVVRRGMREGVEDWEGRVLAG